MGGGTDDDAGGTDLEAEFADCETAPLDCECALVVLFADPADAKESVEALSLLVELIMRRSRGVCDIWRPKVGIADDEVPLEPCALELVVGDETKDVEPARDKEAPRRPSTLSLESTFRRRSCEPPFACEGDAKVIVISSFGVPRVVFEEMDAARPVEEEGEGNNREVVSLLGTASDAAAAEVFLAELSEGSDLTMYKGTSASLGAPTEGRSRDGDQYLDVCCVVKGFTGM